MPTGKCESVGKPETCTVGGPALSVAVGLTKVEGNGTCRSLSVYNVMLSGQVELKDGGSLSVMVYYRYYKHSYYVTNVAEGS